MILRVSFHVLRFKSDSAKKRNRSFLSHEIFSKEGCIMIKDVRLVGLLTPMFFLLAAIVGCGSNETIMPSGDLTDEQKAAYSKEMQSVEDQESGGNNKVIGKKKKN